MCNNNIRKTVFISGSNRGVGFATLNLFAERGWNVIAHSRKQTEEFEESIKEISSKNQVAVTPVYFDMCDELAMKEQIKNAVPKSKITVDALVNNAGVVINRRLGMMKRQGSSITGCRGGRRRRER